MRIARVIFALSGAALAALTTSAQAKHPEPQRAGDKPAPASCFAYEMTPGGKWTQLPCEAAGVTNRTQRKSAARGADSQTH